MSGTFTRKCAICGCFSPKETVREVDGRTLCNTCAPVDVVAPDPAVAEVAPEPAGYRVCWLSSFTGLTGRGSPTTLALAEAWVDSINLEYKGIHHWVERA